MWGTVLDGPPGRAGQLRRLLAPDELARVQRFRFELDRERYIAARGWLRTLLARYTGMRPWELSFRYGLHGKPQLAAEAGGSRLTFNLSHSHDRAVCAVAVGREVGVDLERIREDRSFAAIARLAFSPAERSALFAIPAEQQSAVFHRVWTRKEAFVKATGDGWSMPLNRFEVSGRGEKSLVVVRAQGGSSWTVMSIDTWPGYATALALEGTKVQVVFRDGSEPHSVGRATGPGQPAAGAAGSRYPRLAP